MLNACQNMVNTVMEAKFQMENGLEDFVLHEPPSDEAVEAFERGDNDSGPIADDLHIQMMSKTKGALAWNLAVAKILLADVRVKRDSNAWAGLPERSDKYFLRIIKDRLERARAAWRQAQPRLKADGTPETLWEVENRMIKQRDATGRSNRATTRRRAVSSKSSRFATGLNFFP